MIDIGTYSDLHVLRATDRGVILTDDEGDRAFLPSPADDPLPVPDEVLRVFVYRDAQGRKTATTCEPRILLHRFALLEVKSVVDIGAFLDWGLDKDLFVPLKEQKRPLQVGRWVVVYMDLDAKTDRLYGSSRIERFLQNERLSIAEGDEVELLILRKTDLGFSVIIDHQHLGLIYDSEIFEDLRIGQIKPGWVKTIREDGKVDVSLQPIGFRNYQDANCQRVLDALAEEGGRLPLTSKSPPERIAQRLGMSKKAFKKAIGTLYKERWIRIDADGITLLRRED